MVNPDRKRVALKWCIASLSITFLHAVILIGYAEYLYRVRETALADLPNFIIISRSHLAVALISIVTAAVGIVRGRPFLGLISLLLGALSAIMLVV